MIKIWIVDNHVSSCNTTSKFITCFATDVARGKGRVNEKLLTSSKDLHLSRSLDISISSNRKIEQLVINLSDVAHYK